mmetsp:Transcript_13836/g.24500  ORF Transcript_13836/g.24500 Transcript_13836/m.24500 type:complete len:293 (-) Transcript_13836:313-1191(-)
MHILQLARLALKLRPKGARKVLAQVVARPSLQRPPVAHHGFDGVGAIRARKRLHPALLPRDHRDRRHVASKLLINAQHPPRLLLCLLRRDMRGVSLLPQELEGSDEGAGAHFPAVHVAPLVGEEREIAVAAHPLRKHVVHDRLAGRPHHQRLLQVLTATLGDQSQLGRKAFHVVRLLLNERIRDELREVTVGVPRLLETPVQKALQSLPNGEAVGTDNHRAAHWAIVSQLSTLHYVQVPSAIVFALGRDALLAYLALPAAPLLLLLLLLLLPLRQRRRLLRRLRGTDNRRVP